MSGSDLPSWVAPVLGCGLGGLQAMLVHALLLRLDKKLPVLIDAFTIAVLSYGVCSLFSVSTAAKVVVAMLIPLLVVFSSQVRGRRQDESNGRGLQMVFVGFLLGCLVWPVAAPFFYRLGSPAWGVVLQAYALSSRVFPFLAPLGWWLWRSLQIRPGIDEPFVAEEAR